MTEQELAEQELSEFGSTIGKVLVAQTSAIASLEDERRRLAGIILRVEEVLSGVDASPGWKVSNAHVKVLRSVRQALKILDEAIPDRQVKAD